MGVFIGDFLFFFVDAYKFNVYFILYQNTTAVQIFFEQQQQQQQTHKRHTSKAYTPHL